MPDRITLVKRTVEDLEGDLGAVIVNLQEMQKEHNDKHLQISFYQEDHSFADYDVSMYEIYYNK